MSVSFYDILNVPYHASLEEIKTSFRKMAKRYHPDTSSSSESQSKFKLIMQAYKVLGNEQLKKAYDENILNDKVQFNGGKGYIKIPRNRIDYAASLKNLANSGLLAEKKIRRKHRLQSFGYDISITLTPSENKRGAAVYLSLPAKGACHVCYGSDMTCYLCEGMGSILSVEDLEILLPPNIPDGTFIDVNLRDYPPSKLSYFTLNQIKILIRVSDF